MLVYMYFWGCIFSELPAPFRYLRWKRNWCCLSKWFVWQINIPEHKCPPGKTVAQGGPEGAQPFQAGNSEQPSAHLWPVTSSAVPVLLHSGGIAIPGHLLKEGAPSAINYFIIPAPHEPWAAWSGGNPYSMTELLAWLREHLKTLTAAVIDLHPAAFFRGLFLLLHYTVFSFS